VVGEETGILGALVLLILFSILLWRGIKIAGRAPDELGALLAAGLTLWIAFEAFINMAVMVNLLPFAGNALPLISAGGSNMIVTMVAIGIILNISRLSVQTQESSGRFLSAVVDLRGRYGWRRVPRTDRSAGVER
jgi:cell division protein FtsW